MKTTGKITESLSSPGRLLHSFIKVLLMAAMVLFSPTSVSTAWTANLHIWHSKVSWKNIKYFLYQTCNILQLKIFLWNYSFRSRQYEWVYKDAVFVNIWIQSKLAFHFNVLCMIRSHKRTTYLYFRLSFVLFSLCLWFLDTRCLGCTNAFRVLKKLRPLLQF